MCGTKKWDFHKPLDYSNIYRSISSDEKHNWWDTPYYTKQLPIQEESTTDPIPFQGNISSPDTKDKLKSALEEALKFDNSGVNA